MAMVEAAVESDDYSRRRLEVECAASAHLLGTVWKTASYQGKILYSNLASAEIAAA